MPGKQVGRAAARFVSLTSYLDLQSIPELRLHERDHATQRTVVCLIATTVGIRNVAGSIRPCSVSNRARLERRLSTGQLRLCSIRDLEAACRRHISLSIPSQCCASNSSACSWSIRTPLRPAPASARHRGQKRHSIRVASHERLLGSAMVGSLLLLTSDFRRRETSLTSAYVLMLVCVPVFASLMRRIHNVRAIEHEQAAARP